MTNHIDLRIGYGMINGKGLHCVCVTPEQVVNVLVKGGSFENDEMVEAFNECYPKIYVDCNGEFENLKQEVIKKYQDGFNHWRKWCKFLDGEIK